MSWITAEGGFCIPSPLPKLSDERHAELLREERERADAENMRRAQPITVTTTVGEWEDMQSALRWWNEGDW